MNAKPFLFLLIVGLIAGGIAVPGSGQADCLRMRIGGEGIAEPLGKQVEDRAAAAEQALALAIRDWEANAVQQAGDAYGVYENAQQRVEDCVPLQRNLMSPIRCEVTATPCKPD